MLITKFNKLIKNRIMWGIFAAVICFSFVFGGIFGRGGNRNDRKPGVAGTLLDEEVSNREFFTARFYELGMRERPGLSPEAHEILRDRTWKRIAALRAAGRMGLTVSPEEVSDVIQRDPSFHVNGVFSKARYQATVESQLRIGMQVFEDYVRQDILIRKLMQTMQSMVWNSPEDVSRRLQNITDQFRIEYAVLPADEVAGDVQVSVEDAEAYYAENREEFTEPEKINVKYVAFPVTNYLARVNVSEDETSEYYQENQDDYLFTTTNGNAEPLPFDDVKESIVDLLARRKATFKARDDATDLVMAMAPGRYSAGLSMQEAASGRGLSIATTELFSATGSVSGLDDVDSEFNRTAFNLDPDSPDTYFSDPIVGYDNVYVIAANERVEERIPEFDEVAEQATEAAGVVARREALFEECDRIRGEAASGEKTFTRTLVDCGVSVSTTEVFTVYEGDEDIEFSEALLPEIMLLQEGEVSACIPVPVGAMLAYVAERTPGDIATAQLLRPQLQTTLSRYRAGIVYEDWGDYLLSQSDFKDLSAVSDDEEKDEEDEG